MLLVQHVVCERLRPQPLVYLVLAVLERLGCRAAGLPGPLCLQAISGLSSVDLGSISDRSKVVDLG